MNTSIRIKSIVAMFQALKYRMLCWLYVYLYIFISYGKNIFKKTSTTHISTGEGNIPADEQQHLSCIKKK